MIEEGMLFADGFESVLEEGMLFADGFESVLEEGMLFADGFESAFIGVGVRCGCPNIAVYDTRKCIASLMGQGMTHEEAL